ncbi:phenylacetate--CoA ligase family protein [Anaerotruncus colihominis]|uniref:phenylacetate--CoA ligase family protein n=1 Tax=Anaerotruncus colihominis TaxID=169435 RepID=UPI0026734F9A|nr:hypothetical protein [Anaerotruncus colihominis]
MPDLRKLYHHIPEKLRFPADYLYARIPEEIKYGEEYRRVKALLEQSQWWSEDRLIAYQEGQMKSLLVHAYDHVPYYKKVFDDAGFNPYAFRHLDEIEVLPFLTKELVQEHFDDLTADNIPLSRRTVDTTGGSSGNQLRFYTEKNARTVERPFVLNIWGRVGYRPGSRMAVLRNDLFIGKNLNRPYYYSLGKSKLILNNFHLTDDISHAILDKISADKIEYLHTYPSAAMALCDYISRSGYQLKHRMKAILATSENVYPGQQETINEMLQSRLFTFYGHTERAGIAGWCEYSDLYHVQSEYGYMELVEDQTGRVIKEADQRGEIVCTGFWNYAMPFIRYRTADYSSYAQNQLCECGRHYRLMNQVEGRWRQEMLVLRDGGRVSATAINMHSDAFRNVKRFQLYQDQPGVCVIRIEKADAYNEKDEMNLRREFICKLGDQVDLVFDYTTGIEKTQRNKCLYLIQKLKI